MQHIDSRIKYVRELQNKVQSPALPIQKSKDSKDLKDSKDSRNKSRSGEPAPVHKNYNVFPETHLSVFGKPVCGISRALSSIRNLPTTSNKKAFLTFALRMLAHDPKVKEGDVQELLVELRTEWLMEASPQD